MNFNKLDINLYSMFMKKMIKAIFETKEPSLNIKEILDSSNDILEYDTKDKILLSNQAFIASWSLLRQKAEETKKLIQCLLLLKKKYKITDLDFELILENFDEDDLFKES
jgi:hypothetical protein